MSRRRRYEDAPDDEAFLAIPSYNPSKRDSYRNYVQMHLDNWWDRSRRRAALKRAARRTRQLNQIEYSMNSIKSLKSQVNDLDTLITFYNMLLSMSKRFIKRFKVRFVNIAEYNTNTAMWRNNTAHWKTYNHRLWFVKKRFNLLQKTMILKLSREWSKYVNPSWFE